VQAACNPEKIYGDFKAYASRALNKAGYEIKERKKWARQGSTKYEWTEEDLVEAIDYVVRRQGEPMAVYVAEWA
jgi:hypothetical protein